MECPLCQRVLLLEQNSYPYLIHEFEHSYLLLGEHQFYRGYCVLLAKQHYREMTDLPKSVATEVFQELLASSRAIERAFSPKKMNMCSLGNVVDHIHWHLFPRYSGDPEFKNPPWLQMHQFESARTNPSERQELIDLIQKNL